MHLLHIPQCSIQNKNAHISVLNGALWDMERGHSGICEIGIFEVLTMACANMTTTPTEKNTSRIAQNGLHFADDISKRIFLNENIWNSIKISLKFDHKAVFQNKSPLVHVMVCHRIGDKPLPDSIMTQFIMIQINAEIRRL